MHCLTLKCVCVIVIVWSSFILLYMCTYLLTFSYISNVFIYFYIEANTQMSNHYVENINYRESKHTDDRVSVTTGFL